MRPADTTPDAHAAQVEAWRRLGPEGRVATAVRLSAGVRELAAEGIRRRHPDYTAEQVRRALLRLMYGDALARALWPDDDLTRP